MTWGPYRWFCPDFLLSMEWPVTVTLWQEGRESVTKGMSRVGGGAHLKVQCKFGCVCVCVWVQGGMTVDSKQIPEGLLYPAPLDTGNWFEVVIIVTFVLESAFAYIKKLLVVPALTTVPTFYLFQSAKIILKTQHGWSDLCFRFAPFGNSVHPGVMLPFPLGFCTEAMPACTCTHKETWDRDQEKDEFTSEIFSYSSWIWWMYVWVEYNVIFSKRPFSYLQQEFTNRWLGCQVFI